MKGAPVILGVLAGVLVLVLLYYFYTSKSPKYQWIPNLRHDSEQPYGTAFLKKMLESYRTDGEFDINQKLPFHKLAEKKDFSSGETDLVVVGHSLFFDDADIIALKKFLRDGNDIFISTSEVPRKLLDSVYTGLCPMQLSYDDDPDSILRANFFHERFRRSANYEFRYRFFTEDIPYSWNRVSGPSICEDMASLTPLGYQGDDNHVNFFRINYEGKGNIYIHTEPIMFTNYFLVQPDKVDYASAVFSHLSGKNMIWDEVSKLPFSDSDNPYESPLYYIMQQPALKYAWWMLLAGALLYIIFASKRRQRVIPVLEAKTNTSLEFLNVISSLHYRNPNHLDMARKKMKYFLYFIRARYGINTQTFTEEHAKRLAERSKVDFADIQMISDRYKVIENYSISNDEPERLIGLYQAIEKFYKTCK